MYKALIAAVVALISYPAGRLPVEKAASGGQRVLIVGGGPNLSHNQVAIESNVRYVMRMLPDAPLRVLFTDGDTTSQNVLYEDEQGKSHYRAPQIPHIDGPSKLETVKTELANLAGDSRKTPVFLYFTGHGSPNERSQYANNEYDLWKGDALSVQDLASSLRQMPRGVPVTLLMVECFSGAFANLLFEGGDPGGQLTDQPICGFFASVPQRPAAGCTPALNEAEYKDFTSYFVAALTGTDRVGRPVTGADYNHDGKVGMDEAFCYSLIHDDSIDTPVCTSDAFLRRFVTTSDDDIFAASFTNVERWATPAQRAALDALSDHLSLTGDDRDNRAYDSFRHTNLGSEGDRDTHLVRFVRLVKSVVLAHDLEGMPDQNLKNRFAQLKKLEAGNPFKN